MLAHQDLKGYDLPPKTLCLTFDDGPGPHTLELGRFLFAEGAPAAFFVVGRHAEADSGVLGRLADWGFLIGNHTYSHPGLVALAEAGGDVVGELAKTDEIIRPYCHGVTRYFRAPYGNWRRRRPDGGDEQTSVVAEVVNRSDKLLHYVGPVNWDVCGEDWECWRRGLSPDEALARHLYAVGQAGRGILLLHDSSEQEEMRPRNRTAELTARLVPALKARGYRFVRLDEVPQVRAAARAAAKAAAR